MISSTKIVKPVRMMDVNVSKGKSIIADGLIERTSSTLDETEPKTARKDEVGDRKRKKK